jgi:hypothetical protein
LNRIRWLILILGPLPIIGSSWALSAWLKPQPRPVVMRNRVLPGRAEEPASAARPARHGGAAPLALEAGCEQQAERLRATLGPDCQVVVRSPFVLGGDLARGELEALHSGTIAPAVRAMRNCYFDTEPSRPVTVLVFGGEKSYNRYCQELFDERGISIYGYYKPKLHTLVLNLGTGNGTLLHELTHALASFDFPDMPDWFNEGLASLHEQSRFRAGKDGPWIEGLVNWRLAGLQNVLRAGEHQSLAELMGNTRFRGAGEGINYAQARYFCLYMQQKGVLAKFYRSFRRDRARDPQGLQTLAGVFPGVGFEQLDRDFEHWVLGLSEARER